MELIGELYRRQYGRLVASLVRLLGGGAHRLDWAEEFAQDALVRALETWPYHGVPPNPEAWLFTVARRRAVDRLRRERLPLEPLLLEEKPPGDDQLAMMLLCCHPSLNQDQQIALTLQAVCGLNARQIARGLLLAESTVAQRLVRAKRKLRKERVRFDQPGASAETLLRVLYLLFNEGYASTEAGAGWYEAGLCAEAIYLAGLLAASPASASPAVHALLALFHFQVSRLPARLNAAGEAVPLPGQDRSRWDRRSIAAGFAHLEASAAGAEVSAYHVEAEIAAIHAAAPSFGETGWARIVSLYDRLERSPAVSLNRAIALGYRDGPAAGLTALSLLADDARGHLLPAARAEFLHQLQATAEAASQFALAARRAPTEPERRYLAGRRDMLERNHESARTGTIQSPQTDRHADARIRPR